MQNSCARRKLPFHLIFEQKTPSKVWHKMEDDFQSEHLPLRANFVLNSHHECISYLKELMAEKEHEFRNRGSDSNFKSQIDIMSTLSPSKTSTNLSNLSNQAPSLAPKYGISQRPVQKRTNSPLRMRKCSPRRQS